MSDFWKQAARTRGRQTDLGRYEPKSRRDNCNDNSGRHHHASVMPRAAGADNPRGAQGWNEYAALI